MISSRAAFVAATLLFWNAVGYYAVRCPHAGHPAEAKSEPENVGAAAGVRFTAAEVARHRTPEDCWVSIAGKVYDIGPFIDIHPGDIELMKRYCGKDASGPYAIKESGKEKGQTHSPRANEFLEEYYKGLLSH